MSAEDGLLMLTAAAQKSETITEDDFVLIDDDDFLDSDQVTRLEAPSSRHQSSTDRSTASHDAPRALADEFAPASTPSSTFPVPTMESSSTVSCCEACDDVCTDIASHRAPPNTPNAWADFDQALHADRSWISGISPEALHALFQKREAKQGFASDTAFQTSIAAEAGQPVNQAELREIEQPNGGPIHNLQPDNALYEDKKDDSVVADTRSTAHTPSLPAQRENIVADGPVLSNHESEGSAKSQSCQPSYLPAQSSCVDGMATNCEKRMMTDKCNEVTETTHQTTTSMCARFNALFADLGQDDSSLQEAEEVEESWSSIVSMESSLVQYVAGTLQRVSFMLPSYDGPLVQQHQDQWLEILQNC